MRTRPTQRWRRSALGPAGRSGSGSPKRSGAATSESSRSESAWMRRDLRVAPSRYLDHDEGVAIDPQRDATPGVVGLDRDDGGLQQPASRGSRREVLVDQAADHLGETARFVVDERDAHGSQQDLRRLAPIEQRVAVAARPRAAADGRSSGDGSMAPASTSSIARSHQAWIGQSPANRSVERARPVHAELQLDGLARVHAHDDDAPAAADHVDGGLERGGMPDRIDHHVGTSAFGRPVHGALRGFRSATFTGMAPTLSASARRSGSRSSAKTRAHPDRAERLHGAGARRARMPTTATASSGRGSAIDGRVDPGREDIAHEHARARRRTSSGIGSRLTSAERHANALGLRPGKVAAERARRPGWPSRRRAAICPRRQNQHAPQAMSNATTTRSPGREAVDAVADRLHDAHRLVAHDVARVDSEPSRGRSAGPTRRSRPA